MRFMHHKHMNTQQYYFNKIMLILQFCFCKLWIIFSTFDHSLPPVRTLLCTWNADHSVVEVFVHLRITCMSKLQKVMACCIHPVFNTAISVKYPAIMKYTWTFTLQL